MDKKISHGRIGEAAVYAKCWMHGIPAYYTGGLRTNFAGSDLIIDTEDKRTKLWIQVKTGYQTTKNMIYLTQCAGDGDLKHDKFVSDFVIFVNLDRRIAIAHDHDGKLDFEHLSYYIVPRDVANRLFLEAVTQKSQKKKQDGGQRKLANMDVNVSVDLMKSFHNAWHLIRNVTSQDNQKNAPDQKAVR